MKTIKAWGVVVDAGNGPEWDWVCPHDQFQPTADMAFYASREAARKIASYRREFDQVKARVVRVELPAPGRKEATNAG